ILPDTGGESRIRQTNIGTCHPRLPDHQGALSRPQTTSTKRTSPGSRHRRRKGAVGGEEKREEGAVGGEDSEEDETLQLLYESLSIEEPTQAPIPTPPKPTGPTRQGRARGRGLLMYSPESLRKNHRESPRER
ncbi:Uncharacterized protein APZ42_003175, partial [Daphnia magna]